MARKRAPGEVSLRQAAEQTGIKEQTLRLWVENQELPASGGAAGYYIRLPLPDELREAHPRAFANGDARLATARPSPTLQVEVEWKLESERERARELEKKLKELRERLEKTDELVAWLRGKLDQAMDARDKD